MDFDVRHMQRRRTITIIKDVQKMKKKKKKIKLTKNEILSNYSADNALKHNTQLITTSPKKITASCDEYLNFDKTGGTDLLKDEFSTHISIANVSEVEKGLTLKRKLKEKKKNKMGDKKKIKNNKKNKKIKASLKTNKFYTETCDEINKNLSKDIIGATNLTKDELTTCISISNVSERGNIQLTLKKHKKKMRDKKKVHDNNNFDNNKALSKTETNQNTLSNEDCKVDFHLNEFKKKANKDKTVTNINTNINSINEEEYTRLKRIIKKIKKEKKKKKNLQVQLINNLENENDAIHSKKRVQSKKNMCSKMLLDLNEPFQKNLNYLADTSLCTDYGNALLKSQSKKIKKKFKKSKIATKEETETSKDKTKHKNHKKMKYLNKVITEDYSKEINMDTAIINNTYNSRISKIHENPPKILQKLLKRKKKKALKVTDYAETMSQKKSNKHKGQTFDKEYSENNYTCSMDMDKETYNSNVHDVSENSKRNLEIVVTGDNHTLKYRSITNTDLYFSPYYSKELKNTNSVHSHENVHIRKLPLVCNVCFKTFISKSKLSIHKRTHTGEKPYACNVCGRSFAKNSSLVVHYRTHTGEKPYACEVCGRSFTIHKTLAEHKRTHTGEKPYACNVCGRSFTIHKTLAEHKRTHTGEKPYACEVCGRSFTIHKTLVVHKRTHTGEKPYACEVCGRSFTIHKTLAEHKRTHTGEKPYACEVCGRSFTIHKTLADHKRTHTGEKPYACEVCGRSFTIHKTLADHKRTHTGEKPYACGHCEKKFSRSSNCRRHTRIMHIQCF
ncbi:zinc finger protein 716-like isoform X2 [Rhopalosiphum padi]|uniref:zinc finger protein 716-like isoform X2 n=1 Tax=Rhopalosiphum padi TaxID=40932 RepID=UPI00298D8E07|nr:zinc finger protein 716-like isoform X2 [Rhopalosiphum padi]